MGYCYSYGLPLHCSGLSGVYEEHLRCLKDFVSRAQKSGARIVREYLRETIVGGTYNYVVDIHFNFGPSS
jgi:uncharacterized protein YbcV (DUF1398 family)